MSGTTIAGAKFSDQTAALLDWAGDQEGWRIEPNTRGGKGKPAANSVIVYPADKDIPPVTVNERGGRFNKAHYENLRRELYAAGLPPLPADGAAYDHGNGVATSTTGTPDQRAGAVSLRDLARAADPRIAEEAPHLADANIQAMLDAPGSKAAVAGTLVDGVMKTAGLGTIEAELMGRLTHAFVTWTLQHGTDRLDDAARNIEARVRADMEVEIQQALDLAATHEATATRALDQLAKAEARETQARTDCAAALRRAEAAEAEAGRLEAALAPLRAILGSSSAYAAPEGS